MSSAQLRHALQNEREIEITVKGRRTGRKISLPVWFAVDDDLIRLLPIYGSRNNWYRNLLKNREIGLSIVGLKVDLRANSVMNKEVIERTIQLFKKKYGEADVKSYYSRFDAAVELPLKHY